MSKLTISWKNRPDEKPVAVFTGSVELLNFIAAEVSKDPVSENYNLNIEYGAEKCTA
jgi:hypothetical protein